MFRTIMLNEFIINIRFTYLLCRAFIISIYFFVYFLSETTRLVDFYTLGSNQLIHSYNQVIDFQ